MKTATKISVIVPLGEGRSSEVLQSIENQEKKVESFIERGDNPSKNRNEGAKKSKTELIAFVNGHTILPLDWSKKVEKFFKEHPEIDVMGGPQITSQRATYFEKISGYVLESSFGSGGVSKRYGGKKTILDAKETMITSANLICRSKVLEKVQFDSSLYPGEDPNFIKDAKKAGFRIAYSPETFVYHRRRDNIIDFVKQNFSYGFVRPKYENIKETLGHPFFLIPSAFLIYILALLPLLFVNRFFVIPLAIYLLFSLLFSIYYGIKNGDIRIIFILPFIYFAIHISYGAGFIWGFIKR